MMAVDQSTLFGSVCYCIFEVILSLKTHCMKYLLPRSILVVVLVSATHIFANAQSRSKWTLEFRPSLNFPTCYVAGSKLNIGFGFNGEIYYRVLPHTSVYAGWGWNLFPQEENQYSNEETGYTFGLQFMHPFPNSEIQYYLRGSAVYNHLEIEKNSEQYSDSGHELGWQADAGVSLPLDYGIALNPGIRFRQISGTINKDNKIQPFDLNHLSIGIGVSKTFRSRSK